MQPPTSPRDCDSPSAKNRKRVAEPLSPPAPANDNETPRILRRHQHRHRNVAAAIWGPDIASPRTPAATSPALKQPFNIYKALLRHPNLFFQFALRLPYPAIIDLYAIDKEFHYRLNKYSVSLIHDYARYHAPLAGYIFSWILYPNLCISDPMLRPMDGREWLARDVPGFRWIGMVLWRERVVKSILTRLAIEGHRVPEGTIGALMKFWCLMEMNTTALRQAFLQDGDIWTNADIINLQLFLVKLDMRFANPILGNGICELSHMLLTQKSLSTLWKILCGKLEFDYDETTEMVVRTYLTEDLDIDDQPWLDDEVDTGVPEEEWGILCREGWQMNGRRMEPAVDMVISEGIRRGLNVHQHYLDFVLYGYVDPCTGRNLPAPRHLRRNNGVVMPREGWPGKLLSDRMVEKLDDEFGVRRLRNEDEMDTSS
ncbi:uncharacterized protein K460DRAFT_277332 [Cucurbitaria berberidis CBS 394.84]|uniref:Uncharacterized protein n=1 Tax=Cucurbitaria berberidis CBS 394.84 TaxID=1168544 RepID=A0A9P4GME6_9PLEO|nr:uncharacterized protein K460DRAFT_277332 [Cucurbitaria berberidis CBS 394.84]KAF1847869.1 hypothetical protein K460DRAFT_277332 [Cucurbitaria berberidis CBS 394.84]